MEHPADIRHRASTIETFVDDELGCEGDHIYPEDFRWLVETVTELADEVERLGTAPSHPPKARPS